MESESHIELSTGQMMPKVGLGTAFANDSVIIKAVDEALECGYRSLDTASMYENEEAIGEALQGWFTEGKLKREEVFITTKLPPYGNRRSDVSRFMDLSLERLKVDYVDLFLVHHPFGFPCNYEANTFVFHPNGDKVIDFDTDIEEIWREMEEQVQAGKAKAIGVSNFSVGQMERIVKIAKIRPAVNQVEVHGYFQQRHLVEKCKELGIVVMAYSPLRAPYTDEGKNISPVLLEHPVVSAIAKQHGKTSAQVLLRFLLQQDIVIIPKSVTPERIKGNIDISNFDLSKEEMESLTGLEKGESARVYHMKDVCKGIEVHKEYPF